MFSEQRSLNKKEYKRKIKIDYVEENGWNVLNGNKRTDEWTYKKARKESVRDITLLISIHENGYTNK